MWTPAERGAALAKPSLDGGDGTDYVYFDYATASQRIIVNLNTGSVGGLVAGTTLRNIEGIYGGAGDDELTAKDATDCYLYGGGGIDILHGGTGNDTLDGGTGHDVIYGSLGADTISDIDDVVLDYSGSPTGVSITLGPYSYVGSGGFAQGDTIRLGDSYHSKFATAEWDLTGFADTLSLFAYGQNTVYAGAGDDIITCQLGANKIYAGADNDTINPDRHRGTRSSVPPAPELPARGE